MCACSAVRRLGQFGSSPSSSFSSFPMSPKMIRILLLALLLVFSVTELTFAQHRLITQGNLVAWRLSIRREKSNGK